MKLLLFSKETTLILKGIAILMMICLHLFNRNEYYSLCYSHFSIGGAPLIHKVSGACNPVGFFCFLSGYGVYFSCKMHKENISGSIKGGGKRAFKLYVSLWLLFLFFVPLCSFFNPEVYPGDINTAITNMFAYTNTWNHTTWFVLPFAMVMLTYGLWIKLLDTKTGVVLVGLGVFFLYYIVAYLYGRMYDEIRLHRYILHCCRFVELLTPFVFGAIAQRLSNFELLARVKSIYLHMASLLLAAVMFIYSTIRGIPLYPLYCAVFMIALANIRYRTWLSKILQFFGKYSMIIWLTHIYYFEVIFKNQIFALRYPMVIFLVVSIISLIVAVILEKITTPITKRIR